ncbi:multicopper oxidase [Xylariomycetidae sp. FL0641]|nr:multicopper oxidase [Xylariomycetidae sp. FL0641]
MGWLRRTTVLLLEITRLDFFSPFLDYDSPQKPLTPPDHSAILPSKPEAHTSSIVCSYPDLEAQGWELCNSEISRDCWIRNPQEEQPVFTQYDVRTDYEQDWPVGVTREYWLEVVGNPEFTPDGFPKTFGAYFNGTYPGPTLEACWGDQLVVHVTNLIPENGTTVHWHGISQQGSNEMDGVNGITQCPIAYGTSFTYNFTVSQYGHTWYHSHYSLQYPDGVAAPLVVHGPSSANWSVDLGPLMIADWVHDTAYLAYEEEMDGGVPPLSDSIVVNGKGRYQGGGSYYETVVTPGKKHLLKLINGGVGTSFVFSIDDHNLTVIANDLVAVEPFTVQSLMVGIGQRYTVIVEAKDQTEGDYWIRTTPAMGCNGFNGDTSNNQTGILRYDSSSTALPQSQEHPGQDLNCTDVAPELLNPIIPWTVDFHPQNDVDKDTYHVQLQNETDSSLGPPGFPYAHWYLGDQPMWLDFSEPTILNIDASIANPNYTVITEEFMQGYIYLILDYAGNVTVTHPIHLHGSDFVILAQSSTRYNETSSPASFNYANPPRRDTALLPAGGFLALAFKPDNPGAWLLHCHIAWHASSGLALQILVRPDNMTDANGDLGETQRVCDDWRGYRLTPEIEANQTDSGI